LFTHRLPLIGATCALALVCGSAAATNGYFAHGYGTKNKALAGAGVALPEDAMIVATNPAGLARVGNRLDAGAAVFAPHRSYEATGAGFINTDGSEVSSGRNLFLIPHFAYSRQLDASSSLGVAVYGNGGMNTKYSASDTPGGFGTFGAGTAGVDLVQLFVTPTYARQLNDRISVGASLILAAQTFKAYGVSSFNGMSATGDTGSESGADSAFGLGARVGVLADVSDRLSLGASYQSRVYMSEFDKYAGLFAEDGDVDIPSNFTLGAAYKLTPGTTVAFDVQHIRYSEVAAIGNKMQPAFNNCNFTAGDLDYCLGGDHGMGFGWDDQTIYKFGLQRQYSDDLMLRAGFSLTDMPFKKTETLFNVLSPATIEKHFTAGFTKRLSKDTELSMTAMYAPEGRISGAPLGQPVTIRMHQFEIEASYGMTW
jgi:long-chain fatty acid transport protein